MARPSIADILADPYFIDIEEIVDPPSLTTQEKTIKEFCNDLITRQNVYQFDGKEKFMTHFEENFAKKLED